MVIEQAAMWWVVAHKILLSAPVPIGHWDRGLGLGLDNFKGSLPKKKFNTWWGGGGGDWRWCEIFPFF